MRSLRPVQVANLAAAGGRASELAKLTQLRAEAGGLSTADERTAAALQRATEREMLSAADVVCTTCAAAGDPRLAAFRFRKASAWPGNKLPLHDGDAQLSLVCC